MKYILITFIFLFSAIPLYAQNVFNPVIIDDYKVQDSRDAVEYLNLKLNPKFPKATEIKVENIKLSGDDFKMITYYYSEYDGATRGTSQYFISFWKDNKKYLQCIGSNILDIYDPVVTVANNIITIKAYKRYMPLSIFYYSFIYEKNNIFFNSIMEISTDGDNNTNMLYHFTKDNMTVNINSIFADKLIKK